MTYAFQGKTAVVTGAGSGIGRAIAEHLARRGASVLVNDIEENRAEAAVAAIREVGGTALAAQGDAGSVETARRIVARAVDEFGHLDIAVANAGITVFGDVLSYAEADFQRLMHVNLQGSFFLLQSAARHMRARDAGGKILLMSSVVGVHPYPGLGPYGMTKAALAMLARTAAQEPAPDGITVNALAPGATVTERTRIDDPDYEATWRRLTPNGRVAYPDDIAAAALYLLSPAAHHVTGQVLVVDGGWTGAGRYPDA